MRRTYEKEVLEKILEDKQAVDLLEFPEVYSALALEFKDEIKKHQKKPKLISKGNNAIFWFVFIATVITTFFVLLLTSYQEAKNIRAVCALVMFSISTTIISLLAHWEKQRDLLKKVASTLFSAAILLATAIGINVLYNKETSVHFENIAGAAIAIAFVTDILYNKLHNMLLYTGNRLAAFCDWIALKSKKKKFQRKGHLDVTFQAKQQIKEMRQNDERPK